MLGVSSILAVLLTAGAIASTPPQASFQQIAERAEGARQADHVQEAIELYMTGLRLRPGWSEGWWSLGSLYYDQDRFLEGQDAFSHFVSSKSHPGPGYALLALCEYETGDDANALKHFRAWASAGWQGTPQLLHAGTFHFALLLTKQGKFVESLYLLASEVAALGDSPSLSEAMGLASLRMHNLPEDYPMEARERIWLCGEAAASAAQPQHEFARADEYAQRLISHYAETPEVHYFVGTLRKFERRSDAAKNEFEQELRISPDHVPAMLEVAGADLDANQSAAAESLATRAVALEPDNAETHHMLGRVLLAQEKYEGSVRELENAKHLAPGGARIRSHLAMAYSRLGRKREADQEAAAFLSLSKNKDVLVPSLAAPAEIPK
jgi:tetratricopeptide (TPR) repeat protein